MAHFGIPKWAELISYGSVDLKATLMSRARKNYSFEPYLTPRAWFRLFLFPLRIIDRCTLRKQTFELVKISRNHQKPI
ncbi:hypothetical protein AL057_01470 [Pseudomonas amygdali pv. myricae]|nr:hypothetical protein AL057_01470 [Pseudomonas amygdali pv. myricae]